MGDVCLDDTLKLILLNKVYYHLTLGYTSLSKQFRSILSALAHFDIAVELKLNVLTSQERFKRVKDPDLIKRAIVKLVGINKSLYNKLVNYLSYFRSSRNQAIHYGYITVSTFTKMLQRDLTDFLLYEIIVSYLNEDKLQLLEKLYAKGKVIKNEELFNEISTLFSQDMWNDLIRYIKGPSSIDASEELLRLFDVIDNSYEFRNLSTSDRILVLVSPLLYLCSPDIRNKKYEGLSNYIKNYWGKYSRFAIRFNILSVKNPTNPHEYIESLINYARELNEKMANRSFSSIDFLYSGIAWELSQILLRYKKLMDERFIDKNLISRVIDTLTVSVIPKRNEFNLLYKRFFRFIFKEREPNVLYASFLPEARLLDIYHKIKEILSYDKVKSVRRLLRRTPISHLNLISVLPNPVKCW